MNAECKIRKLNCCYRSSDKSNRHYACEHRLLIYAKYPLTLKIFIYFPLFIKPVLIFNIGKLLNSLHHEFIRSAHLKNRATGIIITIEDFHYNRMYFGILNKVQKFILNCDLESFPIHVVFFNNKFSQAVLIIHWIDVL